MNFKVIKNEAKVALEGNRFMYFLTLFVIGAIAGSFSFFSTKVPGLSFISSIISLITVVLNAGLYLLSRDLLEGKSFDFNRVFYFFKDLNHALKIIGVSLLVGLIVLGGFILLIIPGIIFGYQYSQAIYVMAENPEMRVGDALKKSKEMMRGYKLDLFVFQLSFIGHILLGIITLGIYFIYISPYITVATHNYYIHLKNNHFPNVNDIPVEAEF